MKLSTRVGLTICGVVALSQAAFADVEMISVEDAFKKVQTGEIVLVDVRTPEEWKDTGLPLDSHSITVDPDNPLKNNFLKKIRGAVYGDTSQPIALICRSGDRSDIAAKALQKQGFATVYNVEGGNKNWHSKDLPTMPFIPQGG